MREVPRIKASYDWLVAGQEAALAEAEARKDAKTVDRLEAIRDTLDRGVFVLLFGQFEQHVTDVFERARDRRAANPDWRARRGWDTPALAGRRLTLETKLALILDRRSASYRAAITAYSLRNHFAHGGTSQPVAAIETFVADLYAWQAALEG